MRLTTIPLALGTAALCTVAAAQNAPAPSATTRTVVAATKLPISADKPLSFRATSIAIAPAQKDTISAAEAGARYGLTAREVAVLRLIGEGLTNRQIGQRLFISTGTAAVHVSNILRKLGVTGRVQAATIAHELGLRG